MTREKKPMNEKTRKWISVCIKTIILILNCLLKNLNENVEENQTDSESLAANKMAHDIENRIYDII